MGNVLSPSAWDGALGEEDFFLKNRISSLSVALEEEDLKKQISSPCVALGEEFFKKTLDGTDNIKSSPSARTTLGEGFPECTIFGTRGRPLSRERHPRSLFPECCTWGRLPRVFLGLPRVHLTLEEAGGSRSVLLSG
jgi:hypothetical protein